MKFSTMMEKIKSSPLYTPGRKVVIARGKPNSSVMIVGESPGKDEDKEGKPFVGRSGKLLDKALEDSELFEFCITNVVPIMPLDKNGSIRKPTTEEIGYFRFFVEKMISSNNPETIIILGASALEGVLGKDKRLKDWVGKRKQIEISGKERNVITLFHPSFHLRKGTEGEFIDSFRQILNPCNIKLDVERISVSPEDDFSLGDTISFDTETSGIDWKDLGITDISLCDGKKVFHFNRNSIEKHREKIRESLLNAKKISGHNLVFDFVVLEKAGFNLLHHLDSSKLFDTKVASWLGNENRNSGLKHLSKTIFGEEMQEYNKARAGSKDGFVNYNMEDAIQTFKLFLFFSKELEKHNLLSLMDHEMKIICPTALMTYYGAEINREKLLEINKKVKEELKKTGEEIQTHFPIIMGLFGEQNVKIDLESPQQLSDMVYGRLKISPPRNEEVGKAGYYSTSTPTLQKIEKTHPVLPLILKYRKLLKLDTSYLTPFIEKFVGEDGRIHPWFKQYGTVTGRYVSQRPNFQQLPNDDDYPIRDIVVSPKGWKMIVLDYSQIELRMAGIISKDPQIQSAFRLGKDLHLFTANEIFGLKIPEEGLFKNHPLYKKYKEKHKKERSHAKAINFCVLYGGEKNRVAELLNCSLEEAEKIIKKFFETYPTLAKEIARVHRRVKVSGYVENSYGRRRRFIENDARVLRQSFNALIQGSCADILKESIGKLHEKLCRKNEDIKMFMTVHDELCFLVKEEKSEEYLGKIKHIMEDFNFPIMIVAEGGIGDSYGEIK